MSWYSIFTGGRAPQRSVVRPPEAPPPPPPPPEPPVVVDVTAGNGGPPSHAHAPEHELRSSQQHRWLFDDGVAGWNRHRGEKEFKPVFHGINFVRESAKTRLWGCPIDLSGDERVVLANVDFSYADLQGCVFARADLRGAQLFGADLRKADLTCALANGANLEGCDLRGAILDGAQFARANLRHANLAGARMKDANFAWADLSHAIVSWRNLQEARLMGAIRTTVRPPERYYPPAHPR